VNPTGDCGAPLQALAMREVLFVLTPDLVLLDLAGPLDAFRCAELAVPGSYRLRFIADKASVAAAGGLILRGLQPLPSRLASGSILVLIGTSSQALRNPATPRLLEWLRAHAGSAVLMCVCVGSVLAARAGLLAGRECTTHYDYLDELRRVEPRARVVENRIFVQDGTVYTSAGVIAGLDLTLHIIEQDLGPRIAANIARELVVYLRRTGTDPALSPWLLHRNHLHPAVHRVQDAVTRNPAASWKASELAAVACTSARNLTRLFAEHAGCTPLAYVQLIRFGLARQLVTQSRLDLERVAARSGFHSAQHLRRVWRRWETRPPSAFRHTDIRALPREHYRETPAA
jgi:transcriptional regulator GlxA family with amidase domain